MIRIISLLLFLSMIGCGVSLKPNYPVNDKYQYTYMASAAITNEAGKAFGAGTVIHNKKGDCIAIVTAAHVVRGMQKRNYEMYADLGYNFTRLKLTLHKIDEDTDVAILKSVNKAKRDGPAVKLGTGNPKIGDEIYTIGSPLGDKHTLTTGNVSNYEVKKVNGKKIMLYRITADVFFGNSGGGVFNSNGELVGVVHGIQSIARIIFVPGGYFAISLKHIQSIM